MTRRGGAPTWVLALVAGILLVLVAIARGDEPAEETGIVRTHSPATCRTDGGSDLRLPAGYFLPEAKFSELDASLKTLQDAQTRLTAENTSLRASAAEHSWGWVWAGVAGVAAGVLVGALYL